MKIILLADIKNIGKKDDVVEVNDNYARNVLIRNKQALEATSSNVHILNNKKQSESKHKEREIAAAQQISDVLSKMELVIKSKTGESGRLFGSITSKDISDKLKELHNLDVDKKRIEMKDHIKCVGNYSVDVKLYTGITVKLTVVIKQE